MLIPSDEILKWLADVTDEKNRLIIRSARSRRADEALMGCGGIDALSEFRNRVQAYIDRETYASMKQAEREARKTEKKLRSISSERKSA